MYNVLIADDETIVRVMLNSMIDWEEMELKLVSSVSNGREAIAYLEQNQVDILITDIQMPVVDGLALIEYAKQMKAIPEILVLSAYNDFPYVRQAFKMGVYDYCLKREISGELMRKHLQNMKQRLMESGRREPEIDLSQQNRSEIIKKLFRGEIAPELAGLPSSYCVVYFSIQGYQKIVKNFGENLNKDFLTALLNLANQISQIANHGIIVPVNVTNLVMIYELKSGSNSIQDLLRVCGRLLRAWKSYMNIDVTAAISESAQEAEQFESRLIEATLNLTMKYVMKSQNLFSPEDYPRFSPAEACAHEDDFQEIIQALKMNNESRYNTEKSRILTGIQKESLENVKVYSAYLVYHVAAALVHQLEDIDYIYTTNLLEEISQLETLQDAYIWVTNFLSDMKKYMQSHYQFDFPDEIQRAINYINDYYYKTDLSLYEVAKEVGFSEKYFSTLFSKKVGMSFSGYLRKLRIHHAKIMLTGTNMKLQEISDAIGYNSVEYFVRVFSADTGISPSVFRKKKEKQEI